MTFSCLSFSLTYLYLQRSMSILSKLTLLLDFNGLLFFLSKPWAKGFFIGGPSSIISLFTVGYKLFFGPMMNYCVYNLMFCMLCA